MTTDFNGDRHADLAVTDRRDGTVSILLGNAKAPFAGPLDKAFWCCVWTGKKAQIFRKRTESAFHATANAFWISMIGEARGLR